MKTAAPVPRRGSGHAYRQGPDLPRAGLGRRLGACLVDYLFFFGVWLVALVVIGVYDVLYDLAPLVIAALVPFFIQAYLLADRAQSVGKILFRIRIVDHADGGHPGLVRTLLVRTVLPALALPILFPLFPILDGAFIFGRERRCLHDYLARTAVVGERDLARAAEAFR